MQEAGFVEKTGLFKTQVQPHRSVQSPGQCQGRGGREGQTRSEGTAVRSSLQRCPKASSRRSRLQLRGSMVFSQSRQVAQARSSKLTDTGSQPRARALEQHTFQQEH